MGGFVSPQRTRIMTSYLEDAIFQLVRNFSRSEDNNSPKNQRIRQNCCVEVGRKKWQLGKLSLNNVSIALFTLTSFLFFCDWRGKFLQRLKARSLKHTLDAGQNHVRMIEQQPTSAWSACSRRAVGVCFGGGGRRRTTWNCREAAAEKRQKTSVWCCDATKSLVFGAVMH